MGISHAMTSFGESVPLPDAVTRAAIGLMVGQTQRRLARSPADADSRFAGAMAPYPIAVNTTDANAQHYEIPADFFTLAANDPVLAGRKEDTILDSWVFAGAGIDAVWRRGKKLVSAGRHCAHESVVARYGEVLRRLMAA